MMLANSISAQTYDSISLKFQHPIPVMNMGTFHMGTSSDADTVNFNEYDQENIRKVHAIAQKIAEFKPTIIVVERNPDKNTELNKSYQEYLVNPQMQFTQPSEIELFAFEVGRLSRAKRIYGIDHKQQYNYSIGWQIPEALDRPTYIKYMRMLDSLEKEYPEETLSLNEHLILCNTPKYWDLLININADMLMHISSPGQAEGAIEASKFYSRNLIMYSNLNQIPMDKNDRVFILMGATHTAFFDMFLKRSPKYITVDARDFIPMK